MNQIASKDQDRSTLLEALYDHLDGDTRRHINYREVAKALEWDDHRARDTAMWLADHGWAEPRTMGGQFGITVAGADAVERSRREEDREGQGTAAVIMTIAELRQVEEVLSALESAGVADRLEGDDLAEFEADRAALATCPGNSH